MRKENSQSYENFPCARIGLDAQGGGVAIEEALHDKNKLKEGEQLIWPVIDYKKVRIQTIKLDFIY